VLFVIDANFHIWEVVVQRETVVGERCSLRGGETQWDAFGKREYYLPKDYLEVVLFCDKL